LIHPLIFLATIDPKIEECAITSCVKPLLGGLRHPRKVPTILYDFLTRSSSLFHDMNNTNFGSYAGSVTCNHDISLLTNEIYEAELSGRRPFHHERRRIL
jgi:hypothetical protein